MYKKQIFTVDKQTYSGLNTFVNDLHDAHMRYVVIVVSKFSYTWGMGSPACFPPFIKKCAGCVWGWGGWGGVLLSHLLYRKTKPSQKGVYS